MLNVLRTAKTPPERSGDFRLGFGLLGAAIVVLLSPLIAVYMIYCQFALGSKRSR